MWNCLDLDSTDSADPPDEEQFWNNFHYKDPAVHLNNCVIMSECVLTCLPSCSALISLKVVWNSPIKSCFPLESQSQTVHWNTHKETRKHKYTFHSLRAQLKNCHLNAHKHMHSQACREMPCWMIDKAVLVGGQWSGKILIWGCWEGHSLRDSFCECVCVFRHIRLFSQRSY